MTRAFSGYGAGGNGDVETQMTALNPSYDHLVPHTPSSLQANSLQLSGSPYSPGNAAFRSGPSYFQQQAFPEQPRDRHHSFSSSSAGGESQWGTNSYEEPRSRSASLYSLSNQFVGMGVQLDGSINSSAPPLQAIPAELEFPSSVKVNSTDLSPPPVTDSRRMSADGRLHPGKIITSNLHFDSQQQQANAGLPGHAHTRAMTSSLSASSEMNPRSWPWDASMASTMGMRHGSLSAFPYAHHSTMMSPTGGPIPFPHPLHPSSWGAIPFEHSQHSPISPYMSPPPNWQGRHRSMSSSAIPGRPYSDPSASYFAEGPSVGVGLSIAPPSESDATDTTDASAGGPRRRRIKYRRSRTGCMMCRQRKVKCSQDGTPCKQCRVGKRECQYLETIPQRRRTSKSKKGEAQTDEADGMREGVNSNPAASSSSTDPRQQSDSGVVFDVPFSIQHLSPNSQSQSLDPSAEAWTQSPYDNFSVSTPSSSSGSAAPNSVGAGVSPLGLGTNLPLQPLTSTAPPYSTAQENDSLAHHQIIATPLSEWNHNDIFLQPFTQMADVSQHDDIHPAGPASA